jgi:heme/copper-type cytochrome/quinol oxidase subunit 2
MILKVNIKHADVILPEDTHVRFIVTAGDVIHKKIRVGFLF